MGKFRTVRDLAKEASKTIRRISGQCDPVEPELIPIRPAGCLVGIKTLL